MEKVSKDIISSIRTTGDFTIDKVLDSEKMNSKMKEHIKENEEKIQLGKRNTDKIIVGEKESIDNKKCNNILVYKNK